MWASYADFLRHEAAEDACEHCGTTARLMRDHSTVGAEYSALMDPTKNDGRPPAGMRSHVGYLQQALEARQVCRERHDVSGEKANDG